jgi:hypothetical protein
LRPVKRLAAMARFSAPSVSLSSAAAVGVSFCSYSTPTTMVPDFGRPGSAKAIFIVSSSQRSVLRR